MKQQRHQNQAIELIKDMRDWSATAEQLKLQRRSAKIAIWTLYITIATFLVALATFLATFLL
jgi:hypothetical protein